MTRMVHFATQELKNIFSDPGRGIDLKYRWYRFKWIFAPRWFWVTRFPTHLDIEITSACNLRCIMCFQTLNPPKPGFMKMELFKKIVDEGAKKGLCSIKLNWRGEPLLHPKVIDMVKYAKKKGIIDVQFNTNGQLLDKKKADGLIKAGLDRIIIASDGASKKTYEKIRRGGSYPKLLKNADYLLKRKKKLGSKRPFVRVQMVITKENKHEVDKFIKYWTPKVNEVFANPEVEYRHNKPAAANVQVVGRKPCSQLWHRMVITYDGKAMMCCGDWRMKNIIGDATKQSIHSIWHGKTLKRIRKLHKQLRHDLIPACKNCLELEGYQVEEDKQSKKEEKKKPKRKVKAKKSSKKKKVRKKKIRRKNKKKGKQR
ncbi:radical SAM protein [Candidatus Woesearchaeota archaeon]|nr:radical SAM protein [Candidatus Woesearchaeota archaeon]